MGIAASTEEIGLGENDNMSLEDEDSLSDVSESDADLASILNFLIRSGQVRILGSSQTILAAGGKKAVPNSAIVRKLQKSELAYLTRNAAGLPGAPYFSSKNIAKMISNRESGRLRGGRLGFSRTQRCALYNEKLPMASKLLDSYDNKIFCGTYSHDGNLYLTATQDRFLRIYDSSNGANIKLKSKIQGRDVGWSILDTAFSPDNSKIAYCSWSTNVHLVDTECESNLHLALPLLPEERRFCVFSVQFTSDGNELLCGANDGNIYIYDLKERGRTYRVNAHDDDVNTVAFADNTSQIFYTGGDDGFCKVWDRRLLSESSAPKPVGILAGHLHGVVYIDSRMDGRHLISNSKDQSIKLWDIRVFSSLAAQANTKKAVCSNKWDYRWQTAPKKLLHRTSTMRGDTSLATYRGHNVLQTQVRCRFSPAFSTGQRYIVSGCALGRLIVYDILTGEIVLQYKGHSTCVRDVSWHPYRSEICTTSWDYNVLRWSHYGESEKLKEDDDDSCEIEILETESRPLRRSQRLAAIRNRNTN